jgi:hypothetical protein
MYSVLWDKCPAHDTQPTSPHLGSCHVWTLCREQRIGSRQHRTSVSWARCSAHGTHLTSLTWEATTCGTYAVSSPSGSRHNEPLRHLLLDTCVVSYKPLMAHVCRESTGRLTTTMLLAVQTVSWALYRWQLSTNRLPSVDRSLSWGTGSRQLRGIQ